VIWKKLGLVYCADGERDWAQSHAYVPTSVMLSEDCIRVYVAFLDRAKVGRVGYVDLDARAPVRVLRVSNSPVLDVGEPGAFDDSGVTPISILHHQGKLYLYYMGWQLGVKVRYFLFTGLAVSRDGGESLERYSRVPIVGRNDEEPFIRSAAHVHWENGTWKMWYVAGDRWIHAHGKQVPKYNIRSLESNDGISWGKKGTVCVDTAGEDEFGLGRPFVIKEDGHYKMWYSIRTLSRGYRLGYAESRDGRNWLRKDGEVGIDVSESGWDSQMICFACLQKTKYGTYMFYNGNNYGESGFGVAVLSR
jgi:predicted GH43/DUF377 family glycosyl hydrolase